jgi:hypothetical protein
LKRLVDTGRLAEEQYVELTGLLRKAGIQFHETQTHLFSFGALWVLDEDFPRATEILRTESQAYAARAREEWEREWQMEYRGSFLRWFIHRLWRSPSGMLARIVLLALALWVFVLWPLSYVVKGFNPPVQ